MKSDTAFMIPIFTHTVENWSEYKEEIIDMLDTGDGDGHKTDYFKYCLLYTSPSPRDPL